MEGSSETFLEILLAIILPPLGVFLKYRCMAEFWISVLLALSGWIPVIIYAVYGCKVEFWISALLTLSGWIPGIIFAVWVITK